MSSRMVAASAGKLVTIAVSATRPSAASDGEGITSWRSYEGFGPPSAAALLDGSTGLTLQSPTGGSEGPELWGYRFEKWWRAGLLNNGSDIVIAAAGQGFAVELGVIGIFERLAVAGTPTTGTATAYLAPLQETQIP